MTGRDYIDSYYRIPRWLWPLSACSEEVDCDVVVIGAGLAGLTATRELLKLGKTVVLLEENRVGWGASGRNGGFVSDGYAEGLAGLESRLGFDKTLSLFKLSQEGTNYVRSTIKELKAPGVDIKEGWLRVLRHDDAAGLEARIDKLNIRYRTHYSFWSRRKCARCWRRGAIFRAWMIRGPFISSRSIMRWLWHRISGAGRADLRRVQGAPTEQGCRALARRRRNRLDGQGRDGVVVWQCLHAGSLSATGTGRATGRDLCDHIRADGQIACRKAIRYRGCIGDTRRAGDYYRVVDGGKRLLWGGRITTRRSEPRQLAQMLKRDILSIYPQLGDFTVTHAWAGLMGYCLHKMPILRELEPGIWAATATGGHGLNATASIGIAAAEGISGLSDRYRMFEPFKARWGGGPVGRVGTQFAYWGLQAMDWWEERGIQI